MNNKGQKSVLGFALLVVTLIFIITAFATIEPFKEFLDTARSSTSLNCRGTDDFNVTAFNEDDNNTIARLTRRPTCFVTGISMVYFVIAFVISLVSWVVVNWRKVSK